jgi:hypothetical protein
LLQLCRLQEAKSYIRLVSPAKNAIATSASTTTISKLKKSTSRLHYREPTKSRLKSPRSPTASISNHTDLQSHRSPITPISNHTDLQLPAYHQSQSHLIMSSPYQYSQHVAPKSRSGSQPTCHIVTSWNLLQAVHTLQSSCGQLNDHFSACQPLTDALVNIQRDREIAEEDIKACTHQNELLTETIAET